MTENTKLFGERKRPGFVAKRETPSGVPFDEKPKKWYDVSDEDRARLKDMSKHLRDSGAVDKGTGAAITALEKSRERIRNRQTTDTTNPDFKSIGEGFE